LAVLTAPSPYLFLFCHLINSVKALKVTQSTNPNQWPGLIPFPLCQLFNISTPSIQTKVKYTSKPWGQYSNATFCMLNYYYKSEHVDTSSLKCAGDMW